MGFKSRVTLEFFLIEKSNISCQGLWAHISFNFIKYLQVQVLSTHEDMFSVGNVKVTFKDGSQFEAKFPSKRSNFHSKIVTAKYYSRLDWLEKDVNDLKNYLRRCQCSSG